MSLCSPGLRAVVQTDSSPVARMSAATSGSSISAVRRVPGIAALTLATLTAEAYLAKSHD